jgi:hypothetical protein
MSFYKERQREFLYRELDKLRNEYHTRAEPYIKALAALAATDPPPPIILPDGTTIRYIGSGHADA